jgi:hypothetical protein
MTVLSKLLIVVSAGPVIAGLVGTTVIAARQPRSRAAADAPRVVHGANDTTVWTATSQVKHGATARERRPSQFHTRISFDRPNYGAPSELLIRGRFEIGTPNPVIPGRNIPDRNLVIILEVVDGAGKKVVELTLGHLTDRPGVGHIEKAIQASILLKKGVYSVRLHAGVPGELLTKLDGTKEPNYAAYFRDLMTVE